MLSTVNVIEMVADEGVISMASYNDDQAGNELAEKRFVQLMVEHDEHVRDWGVDDYIDAGHYTQDDYAIFLIHSTETD